MLCVSFSGINCFEERDDLSFLEFSIRESRVIRVESVGSGVRQLGFELDATIYYHVTLRMSVNLLKPQCSHVQNGNKNISSDVCDGSEVK